MRVFKSADAYFEFVRTIRSERRWIFDGTAKNFLTAVRSSSKLRAQTLKSGARLWRAQVGSDLETREDAGGEIEHPLPAARMIPDAQKIRNGGRANPPGLAYLYLATDENTALAEMRPWVGETLSLATFVLERNVRIVVCQAKNEDLLERVFEKSHLQRSVTNMSGTTLGAPLLDR